MMKKLSRSFTTELLFTGSMWMGLWCTLEPAKSVVVARDCHVNVRFGSSITLQSWLPYLADNNVDLDLWDCPSVTSVDKTLLDPIFGCSLTWTLVWGKEHEGHLVRLATTWSLFTWLFIITWKGLSLSWLRNHVKRVCRWFYPKKKL